MYLKKLELQGFKSFPSNIKLEFNKGITSVVGPNGSGKSNVSDAIRWVLGEQSAKSLRGNKMEDIIFAGTENRKSLGFAEVSITIDNSDKVFKVDFMEIKVTRRVMRSGEGSYSINDVSCRLKDIQELFMDTGIGKEGYSIIGQGRIEEILKSKSEERRLLFEEATGIVKFKSRKKEAEQKLEREAQNLVRLSDIVSELEKQVLPLENQAKKAKEYLQIYEYRKNLKISLFIEELEKYEQQTKTLISLIEKYKEEMKEKENEYAFKENALNLLKKEIFNIGEIVDKRKLEQNENGSEILKKENIITLTNQKIQNILLNIERITKTIEEKMQEKIKHENSINDFIIKNNLIKKVLLSKKEELENKNNDFQKLNISLSDRESEYNEINKLILENLTEKNNLKNKIGNQEQQYLKIEEEKEIIINNKATLLGRNEEKKTSIQLATKNISLATIELENVKEKIKSLEEKQRIGKEKSYELYKQINDANKAYHEKNARLRALRDLEKNHEGYFESVKFILNEKNENPFEYSEVMGIVGEVISTKKEYETAIEIALGGAVQNVITKTEIGAKNIIDILKKKQKGRCTFLPINKVKRNNFSEKSILNEEGVIGLASDIVDFDEIFEPIANHLLGKIIIVDTLKNGINFSNRHKYSHRIVTLDGDVLSTGGSITGGSNNKKRTNIFGRNREIEEYLQEVELIKKQHEKLENGHAQIDEQIKIYKNQLIIGRENLTKLTIQLNDNTRILETSKIEHNNILKELEIKKEQDKSLTIEIIEKNILIQQWQKELLILETATSDLDKRLENYKFNIETNKDEREIYIKELMEYNVEITKMEENKNSIDENIQRVKNEIFTLENAVKSFSDEILMLNNELNDKKEIIANVNLEIEILSKKSIEMIGDISNFTRIKIEKVEMSEKFEEENKALFKSISTLKTAQVKEELRLEQLEGDVRELYDNMWNEFEITLQKAKEYNKIEIGYEEMKKELSKTNNQLKIMGHVNVNAIEQFEEVNERYKFLCSQRDDILEGERQLNIIIDELTNLMTKQFSEQFSLIRNNFREVFKEMFEGGNADVVLSDENDILNSGIDIVAQPPGKKLSNITLLSGGEKSLTAIALLFGILKLKPSPFCILDEIEAALDDANVNRYANYLKKFSQNTQFILITHRKGTMEIADVLYGVTMEEQGVSKLISVKLTDY